jgi:hypothetical protein
MPRAFFTCLPLLLLLLALPSTGLAEEIKPPFNLRWGESTDRMERLLKGAKATIVTRRNIQGREAWEVEGLLQAGLKRTVFYFIGGELVEVELQYQKEDWDEAKYDGFMGDVRRKLEERYGQAQLIARKKDPEGDVMQTLVGWKWSQVNTAIELIYFSAQSPSQVYRTLSVHYKRY